MRIELREGVIKNDLSQYVDSMLFDSGECIAQGVFILDGKEVKITLEVRGDVAVTFKGETLHKPSEIPDELRKRIIENPNQWMNEIDTYIGLNNWFEFIWEYNGSCDGILYEEDLSKATHESIFAEMLSIAKHLTKEVA